MKQKGISDNLLVFSQLKD